MTFFDDPIFLKDDILTDVPDGRDPSSRAPTLVVDQIEPTGPQQVTPEEAYRQAMDVGATDTAAGQKDLIMQQHPEAVGFDPITGRAIMPSDLKGKASQYIEDLKVKAKQHWLLIVFILAAIGIPIVIYAVWKYWKDHRKTKGGIRI